MSNEKEDFCKGNYYTLQEAKNQLYALLTEIMMNEAGYVIDQAIEGSKRGIAELKEVRSQVDNYKSIVNTKKAIKDRLIKEMEVTKRALTEALQEELHNQAKSTGKEAKERIREDTVKWLIHFLKEDKLPTPKAGSQTDQNEPDIYISELLTLTQQAQDKLQNISQLADKTSKASEEEKQAKLELNNYEAEN